MSSPIWHTFSFNLCLSIVRTCSNSTTESFARSYRLESISTCVGSFALFILLVIAAQITVELEDESEYDITIDGADAGKMKTNLGGKLSLSVELGDHPVDVKVTKC